MPDWQSQPVLVYNKLWIIKLNPALAPARLA